MNDYNTLPNFLDRRPLIGTYTMLDAFKKCEHRMNQQYIEKAVPYVETPAMAYGNAGHTAMEKRVGEGKVLPDEFRHCEKYAIPFDKFKVLCEQKLGINIAGRAVGFWDGSVWFRGKADNVVMQADRAMLTDWKFGSSKYEDPFELECGALLLKAKYPQLKKIQGRYVYCKEDKVGSFYDLSDFSKTWQEINRLMALIAEKRQSGEWLKKKSGLCGYCPCKECEHWYEKRN
jgi:hypothetical protein